MKLFSNLFGILVLVSLIFQISVPKYPGEAYIKGAPTCECLASNAGDDGEMAASGCDAACQCLCHLSFSTVLRFTPIALDTNRSQFACLVDPAAREIFSDIFQPPKPSFNPVQA